MAKDDIGRLAGHHITPGRGWRWQQFGGMMMLVTDGGGADVVLSMPQGIRTCAPDGILVPFRADSPLGRVLAELPLMVTALRDFVQFNDRPRQLVEVRGVLERAGL